MRMDRKNPVLKVNAPRFVLWLKGFLDGKVLHTAGIDPENGTVTSGYVTSQLLRFEAACEKRIADTDKKLSPLWTEADHILIDLTRGIGVDTSRENEKRTDIPVVEYLKQNRQKEILLYSTCAGDTDSEYSQKLAAERTKKLSSLLLKEGVEEKQITAIKIDNKNDPYYQWGLKTGPGSEINRKSVMTDIESELAKQLLTNTDTNVIEISKEDQE